MIEALGYLVFSLVALFFYVAVGVAVWKYEHARYPLSVRKARRFAAPMAVVECFILGPPAFWIWWALAKTDGGTHTNGRVVSWSLIFSCLTALIALIVAISMLTEADLADWTSARAALWLFIIPFEVLGICLRLLGRVVHRCLGLTVGAGGMSLFQLWDHVGQRLADIPLRGQLAREAAALTHKALELERTERDNRIAQKENEAGIEPLETTE